MSVDMDSSAIVTLGSWVLAILGGVPALALGPGGAFFLEFLPMSGSGWESESESLSELELSDEVSEESDSRLSLSAPTPCGYSLP